MHACILCGQPGVEHHHVEPRSAAPSRVLDKTNVVILCRRHHEYVTAGSWDDSIEEGDGIRRYIVRSRASGEVIASRRLPPPGATTPLTMSPVVDLLSRASPLGDIASLEAVLEEASLDELEYAYRSALQARAHGYWLQCLVAAECKARFAAMEPKWAAELASRWGLDDSTIRRDARLGEAIRAVLPTLDPAEREALSEATDAHLRVIADSQVPNKVAALRELARWLPEAGNRSARVFAAHLRRLGLKGGSSTYVYRCPQCGWRGRLRDFREEADDE
jgi:hypothetical protein